MIDRGLSYPSQQLGARRIMRSLSCSSLRPSGPPSSACLVSDPVPGIDLIDPPAPLVLHPSPYDIYPYSPYSPYSSNQINKLIKPNNNVDKINTNLS